MERKEPTEAEVKETLRLSLNLTSWGNTFKKFELVKGTESAVKLFKEMATGTAPWHMLLCYGSTGCGKSHLCEALSIEFTRQNIRCRVNEWPEIYRGFKRGMRLGTYDDLFDNLCSTPRLILDDIGRGSIGSNYEWGDLEDIVNYRYRRNLLTVATTNLDLDDLPDRIVSRFRDAVKARIVLISAGDYRPDKVVK